MAEREQDEAKDKSEVAGQQLPANGEAAPENGRQNPVVHETLNEISLTVAVEVGRTVMAVKEICRQFRAGNVLRLDKRKGEPLEVHVNGLLFARAEVVFDGDQVGARIIEIVDPDGTSQHRGLTHRVR